MLLQKDIELMKKRGINIPEGKNCHCKYCLHDYRVIGIKKTRKFYVSEINKLKKELKHLKDRGIKYGYLGDYQNEAPEIQELRNKFAVIRETLDWTLQLKDYIRKIKKGTLKEDYDVNV